MGALDFDIKGCATLQFSKRFETKIPDREDWERNRALGHGVIMVSSINIINRYKTGEATRCEIYGPKKNETHPET